MSNEPSFDWTQAASLLGDDPQQVSEDMVDIVGELIESANGHFEELKKKNPETERKNISSLAHQLRGSLLNFGFTDVGTHLLRLEKENFPAAEYAAMLCETEKVFAASKKLLAARYPSLRLS